MRRSTTILLALPLFLVVGCSETDTPSAPPLTPRFSDTPDPTTVVIAGSLQSELGCPGDWQPDCAATGLTFDAYDHVWQGTFALPAGSWEYKAALNGTWDENYGDHAVFNGANIPLNLGAAADVKFYYDHETHWVTDSQHLIATVPGSFQSELGCAGDWDPSCLRSWLEDTDGDGMYTFVTDQIPAGSYEAKVAIAESWTENYGVGGAPGGANIPFTVAANGDPTLFVYDSNTHVLNISNPTPPPPVVVIVGNLQSELGCAGDWQPDCAATALTFDPMDGVFQGVFTLPAGSWEYKAALNNSWDENYGVNATPGGANLQFTLASPTDVKFYYHAATHWVTSNQNAVIVTAVGSFQSELGCAGDWDPGCLRSWLQDTDGDGVYDFATNQLPPGAYEAKATIAEGWTENYGAGGVLNGPNIAFVVPAAMTPVAFSYDAATHVLTISGIEYEYPPVVMATDPASDATDVALDTDITVTFSEPVNVTGSWFSIQCGATTYPAAVSGGPVTFTLNPDTDLPYDATCTITVFGSGVSDQDTNDPPDHPPGPYSWSFTTRPPTVPERIADIDATIGTVPVVGGVQTALRAKLDAATAALAAGDQATACDALGALLNQIAALAGKKITAAMAADLTQAVQELQAAIGC